MGAQLGNEYYLLRSKDGRDKIFENPEQLSEAANEYFLWCIENPLKEQQVIKYRDTYEKIDVDKMRPFTISGLCNYIDICVKTFDNYSKNQDFLQVTTRIRQIIYTQKFEGAASGFLNPNIIARDLGLSEKVESKNENTETITVIEGVKFADKGISDGK